MMLVHELDHVAVAMLLTSIIGVLSFMGALPSQAMAISCGRS